MTRHFKREPSKTYKNENCNNQTVKLKGNWHMVKEKHCTEHRMAAKSKARKEEAPQGWSQNKGSTEHTIDPGPCQLRTVPAQADSRSPVERTAGAPSNEPRGLAAGHHKGARVESGKADTWKDKHQFSSGKYERVQSPRRIFCNVQQTSNI